MAANDCIYGMVPQQATRFELHAHMLYSMRFIICIIKNYKTFYKLCACSTEIEEQITIFL